MGYSNLSARVSADTAEGVYVAPSSDASGAWVRKFNGKVDGRWFGLANLQIAVNNAVGLALWGRRTHWPPH